MIDQTTQQALRQKYNPDGSTLRRAQLRMAEMLVFLDQICTQYNLRYWLDSGTLLGAMRHGGFIPWDDDTDVCMPVDDLHKLRHIMATHHLSDQFVLQTPRNDKNYVRIEWCVLRDLKSEYVQNNYRFHRGLKYKGLQIDLFPVERGVRPRLQHISNLYQKKLTARFVLNPLVPYRFGMVVAKILRGFQAGVMIPLFRLFNRKSSPVYNYGYGCGFDFTHTIEATFPLQKISFEGHFLNAPHDTDAYLTDLYGDWRKLPAPEEIHTHNVEIKFYDAPHNAT